MSADTPTPSWEEVLLEAFDDRLLDLHTALPGRVESYDVATQTAAVKPLIKLDGATVPVLPNVPVAFPRGGGMFVSFPIQAGDFVFVLFSEQSIDLWRAGSGSVTDPGDQRRHSLTGGVAFPCLYPSSKKLASAHAANLVLGKDGGTQIHVKDGQVALGSENPAHFVPHADKIATELARIQTDLATLKSAISAGLTAVGVGGSANGGTGATAFNSAAAAVPSSPSSVASTSVKTD